MISARLIAITTRRAAPKSTPRSKASVVSQKEAASRSQEAIGDRGGREGEAGPAEAAQAADEALRGVVETLGVHPRQADERAQEKADGAGSPAGEHDDRRDGQRHEHDGEDGGAPKPGDVGEKGRGEEEQDEEREHVVDPLADRGRERLGPRGSRPPVEREDADRLAGATRQDVVEEVPDEERVRGRAHGRPRRRREEQAPAEHADEDGQGEDGERRDEPGRIALRAGPPRRSRSRPTAPRGTRRRGRRRGRRSRARDGALAASA